MDAHKNKSQDTTSEQTVLQQILEANQLDIKGLEKLLGLKHKSLWQYRVGRREFRLNMHQIKTLDLLLQKMGKRLTDLPPDWILEKCDEN